MVRSNEEIRYAKFVRGVERMSRATTWTAIVAGAAGAVGVVSGFAHVNPEFLADSFGIASTLAAGAIVEGGLTFLGHKWAYARSYVISYRHSDNPLPSAYRNAEHLRWVKNVEVLAALGGSSIFGAFGLVGGVAGWALLRMFSHQANKEVKNIYRGQINESKSQHRSTRTIHH